MELTIALLKYTRGELRSCQIPVIAMQAIANGYISESLDILAGESGPVEASGVNPLFEKALHELGVSLPVQAHQSSKESPWPLSAHSPEFAAIIDEAFWKNSELLIQQRFAYVAGANAGWYLIKTREQWQELLDSGRAKTAYTLIWDKDIREITAYIPDADGIVRPGAY